MTDKDKYVDETLRKQIQESFGASDEQLKARMDRIEKTLTDDEFAGAEERMMAKFMARLAVEEKKEEPEAVEEVEIEAVETILAEAAPDVKVDSEVTDETSATVVVDKKVARFGRKKVLLVAALAAAFVGLLAFTGIGENSYFFRERKKEIGVVFNSGKNVSEVSSLDDAYAEIRKSMDSKIFVLHYLPNYAELHSVEYDGEKATIELKIEENYLYFIQWKRNGEASIHTNSDRKGSNTVNNVWLKQDIVYMINQLESGLCECDAQIEVDGTVAWIFGVIDPKEFEDILKNLYFY